MQDHARDDKWSGYSEEAYHLPDTESAHAAVLKSSCEHNDQRRAGHIHSFRFLEATRLGGLLKSLRLSPTTGLIRPSSML